MIRMFDAFRRWCDANNVPSDQINITVAPMNAEVAARFEMAWHREMSNLTLRPAGHQMPTEGHIYGIPYSYRRPLRPFGASGDVRG